MSTEMTISENTGIGYFSSEAFELAQRISTMFAKSELVPPAFQGKLANCVIALNMANRMNADPLMVMQNLYVVHGNPAWSSKFLIACFNSCGRFSAIRYEFTGKEGTDDWGCRAVTTELSTGEKLCGTKITIGLAKKEGWASKNGSKWTTMPEQMLRYRAASFMIKTYAPEIAMGLDSREEVEDTVEVRKDANGTYSAMPEPTASLALSKKVQKLAKNLPAPSEPEPESNVKTELPEKKNVAPSAEDMERPEQKQEQAYDIEFGFEYFIRAIQESTSMVQLRSVERQMKTESETGAFSDEDVLTLQNEMTRKKEELKF